MTTMDLDKREYRMMHMTLIEMSRDKSIDNEDYRECVLRHICINGFGEEIYNDHIVRTSLCDFIKEVDLKMSASAVRRDMNVKDAYNIGNAILRHYEWRKLPTKGIHGLNRVDEVRLAFEAAFVSLIARREESREVTIESIDTFLSLYPEFTSVEMDKRPDKLTVLLDYRNWMRICLLVISPEGKKDHLLDLVTRLAEGKHKKYIAGSGETPWTARRVLIYRREGNVQKNKRPPRRSVNDREVMCVSLLKKMKVPAASANATQQNQSDDEGEYNGYNYNYDSQKFPYGGYGSISGGMNPQAYNPGSNSYSDLVGMSLNQGQYEQSGVGVGGGYNLYYDPIVADMSALSHVASSASSQTSSLASTSQGLYALQSVVADEDTDGLSFAPSSPSISQVHMEASHARNDGSDCTDGSNSSTGMMAIDTSDSLVRQNGCGGGGGGIAGACYSDGSSGNNSPMSTADYNPDQASPVPESDLGMKGDGIEESGPFPGGMPSPLLRERKIAVFSSHNSLDEMDLSSYNGSNSSRFKSEPGLTRAKSYNSILPGASASNGISATRSFSPLDMLVAAAEQVSQFSSFQGVGVGVGVGVGGSTQIIPSKHVGKVTLPRPGLGFSMFPPGQMPTTTSSTTSSPLFNPGSYASHGPTGGPAFFSMSVAPSSSSSSSKPSPRTYNKSAQSKSSQQKLQQKLSKQQLQHQMPGSQLQSPPSPPPQQQTYTNQSQYMMPLQSSVMDIPFSTLPPHMSMSAGVSHLAADPTCYPLYPVGSAAH